jgi:tetratricopeptide (TPR) repeat protein
MTDYVGYLSVELDELQIAYHLDPVPLPAEGEAEEGAPVPELVLVADIAIVDASNVFRWQSNGEVEVKTSEMTAFKKPVVEEEAVVEAPKGTEGEGEGESSAEAEVAEAEAPAEGETEEEEKPIPKTFFTVGFSSVFQRTQFIDLNPEVVGSLANAHFLVTVRDAKAEAPAEGEPVPSLVSVKIPLSDVLKTPGCLLNETTSLLADNSMVSVDSEKISGVDSYLTWRVIGDNDLTEYCIGCTIIQWKGASLSAPPADWALHYADVIDPKAKVEPTAEELRVKYLENIPTIVEGQETVATYTLDIGRAPAAPKEAVEETDPDAAVGEGMDGEAVIEPSTEAEEEGEKKTMLPFMTIGKGMVKFDAERAATVGEEEDIRTRTDLWSIEWGASSTIFLHRSHIREYAGIMTNKYENTSDFTTLPITLTKTPTESGQAEEGEAVLSAMGSVDLSVLQQPGSVSQAFAIDISGGSFDPEPVPDIEESGGDGEGEAAEEEKATESEEGEKPVPQEKVQPSFSLDLTLSAPIIALPPGVDIASTAISVPSPSSSVQSKSTKADNRDVLKELKEEIVEAIKKVATEYVLSYPGDPSADPLNGSALDDRKAEFLYYLSSSGMYHSLKESLKPKIQRVVRAEYGKRGQAMTSKAYSAGSEVNGKSDQLLAEVYVFLIKQCNQVLNTLYTTTIIDKDVNDTEKASETAVKVTSVDDELEAIKQNLIRLCASAVDAENDLRYEDAEQRLLERIQIILNSSSLSREEDLKGEAHFLLGDFYLRLSSMQQSFSQISESAESRQKAREALSVAASLQSNKAKPNLLLACLFHEEQHIERAEARFISVIDEQLQGSKDIALNLSAFDSEFDGYESDKMGPVDPKTYAILACHFSRKGDKLKARKSLRLANASYIEGNVQPSIDTHGSPRRTMVLFLANAGLWLNKHGFLGMAKEALTLANSCDAAASAKANARGFMSNTPAFIRHLVKRLSASVASENEEDMLAFAQESVSCSDDNVDKINGYLCAAHIASLKKDAPREMEALLNALQVASQDSPAYSDKIPVSAYVQCSKLLIDSGKYQEALAVSLTGSTVHTSSALLLQMGIAALRMGMVDDAEKALQESNVLDNRNGRTWAYHTLVCISAGPRRAEESVSALHQSLRLGVTSPVLLRELATAFMGVDKLQTAEELIRRCISVENEKGSFATRILLGDALAGQNQAAKAVEEYQTVIEAEESPADVKLSAAQNCVTLLKTLGRQEEYKAAKQVVAKLKEAME